MLFSASLLLAAIMAQDAACNSTVTGDLEIVRFDSNVFNNSRFLRVWLPPGYRRPEFKTRRYEVLYMNDGENMFNVCTSGNQEEWHADETVTALAASGDIPAIIVVGIDSAGKRWRPHEYLPYPDDTLQPPDRSPEGKLYPKFLLDEVIPWIERHYRVRVGAANRALGGSSYGATAALYTAISRPGSFYGLLLESPSIYASDYQILKDAERGNIWPKRIFIGTGTVREPLEDSKRLEDVFRKTGLDDHRVKRVVTPGGEHSEKWWAMRLSEALKFLFTVR